jgi:hypothetical protein
MPSNVTRPLLDRLGGRRWLTALGLTAVSTWLAFERIITGDAWANFQTFLYGILVFGNVSQRAVEAAREVRMPSTQAPVEVNK